MMNKTIRRLLLCSLTLSFLGVAEQSLAVGTRRFELQRGKDFQGGDLKGVAIDSAGRVHAGLNFGALPIADAQSIWSALPRSDGSLLLGTGNEGKLLEVRNGSVRVLAETKALVVTSLVEGWKGDVLLGTLPAGEIMRWSNGKLSTLAKLPGVEHIWGLAFDEAAQVLFVATGPEGKLFRVDQAGKAQVHFDAEEQHLMSVALVPQRGGASVVYAGASDKAKLYEVRAPGRATVLYDFGRTEVRAIVSNPQGEIFAIANDIKAGGAVPSRDADDSSDSGQSTPPKTSGKGVLFKFSRDGTPEQLLEDADEHYTSLALGPGGQPYVGTGVNGRIYTVDESHNDVLMADTEERQVGVLSIGGKQQFVASSDPAVLHPLRGIGGTDAVWTSKPLDAGLRAHFGQLSWTASAPLELSTRSGNTQQPDDTWSAWSDPMTRPGMTKSPAARYVQIRARWNKDPQAALSDVTLPFVTDNLRAVLTSVDVDKEKDDSASGSGIGSSGGPVNDEADPIVKLKWKVDNPDSDELRYRLQYRLAGTEEWVDILKPGRLLTKNQLDWDTSDLPEGHYRLRVQVSDELSNPPDRVKKHELSSTTIVVDNTPPALTALSATDRRVTGTAVDGVGPISRIEMGVAGSGEWYPFFPRDGIYDQQREDFDVDVSAFAPAGRVIVSVRVYDKANNFVVRHVTLP